MEGLNTTFLESTITKLHLIYTTTKQNTLLAKYHKEAFIGGKMKPRDLGFLAVELKRAGYSVAECEKAGWSLRDPVALISIRKVLVARGRAHAHATAEIRVSHAHRRRTPRSTARRRA